MTKIVESPPRCRKDKPTAFVSAVLSSPPSPGQFLSRSQDCLAGAVKPRKGSTPLLGTQTSASSSARKNLPPAAAASLRSKAALLNSSVANRVSRLTHHAGAEASGSGSTTSNTNTNNNNSAAKISARRRAASQRADARISKTKTTVTELQKAKQELESQLSDLTRLADTKQAEIASLKSELKKTILSKNEEIQALKERNRSLEAISSERRFAFVPGDEPSRGLPSSASEAENAVGNGNYSAFSSADLSSVVFFSAGSASADEAGSGGDSVTESVACLQDRLVRMEETQHSTSEELQATLQELTDLQDIVDQISCDNQSLVDENKNLSDQLGQLSQNLEQKHLQIENLKYLLLSGPEFVFADDGEDERNEQADEENPNRQVNLLKVLKMLHEENEDLNDRVGELRNTAVQLEEELNEKAKHIYLMEKQIENRSTLVEKSGSTADIGELERLVEAIREAKNRCENQLSSVRSSLALEKGQKERLNLENQKLVIEKETLARQNNELRGKVDELEQRKDDTTQELFEVRKSAMELDERFKREQENREEFKANIAALQKHLDDVTEHRNRLDVELHQMQEGREAEKAEWDQFESDLLTAVKVANDFKVETQSCNERLLDENVALRARLDGLRQEVGQLKAVMKNTAAAAGAPPTSKDTDVLLRSISNSEKDVTKRAGDTASLTIRRPPMSSSSVRALIDSLEKRLPQSNSPPAVSSTVGRNNVVGPSTPTAPVVRFRRTPFNGSTSKSAAMADSTPAASRREKNGVVAATCSPRRDFSAAEEKQDGSPAPAKKSMLYSADQENPLSKLTKDAPRGSRRNALLNWCQNRLKNYSNVEITNFSSSWNDGLAFAALIHSYNPDKIDYWSLRLQNKQLNFELAFSAAELVGIERTLSTKEMASLDRPDWKAVMHYVTLIYQRFET